MYLTRVRALICTLALCVGLGGCATPNTEPPALKLPSDPYEMTVIQRRAKTIAGSGDKISLHLHDITAGQVLIEVREYEEEVNLDNVLATPYMVHVEGQSAPKYETLVDTVSVATGDVVEFEAGGGKFFLHVLELRNFIVGDDFGIFEISTKRPKPRESPAEEKSRS